MSAPPDTKRTLPRRDLWLLPLIALMTMVGMYAFAEGALRLTWTQQDIDSCRMGNGLHRPGCRVAMKAIETPWVDVEYDACGFRGPGPCAPGQDDTLNLAVIGSSLAGGAYVPYPYSFTARVAADLTRACGKPVVVHNAGGFVRTEAGIAEQVAPALASKPAALVLVMMPADLERFDEADPVAAPAAAGPVLSVAGLKSLANSSRVAQVGQYYLFGNLSRYADLYLHSARSDFMRDPLPLAWQGRLAQWEALIAPIAARTHAAGIPFFLVLAPQRAQLVLLGTQATGNIRPDILNDQLAAMAARNRVTFVDLGKVWQDRADKDAIYYRLDGHPNALGHAAISQVLGQAMLSGAVPALAPCRQS